jgi:hypothetical protein
MTRKCRICFTPLPEGHPDELCDFGCRTHVAKPRKEKKTVKTIPSAKPSGEVT